MRQAVLVALLSVFALLAARGAGMSATATAPALVYERNGDLFATTVDGSRTVRLTATKLCECDAALSNDGRFVTYIRARSAASFEHPRGGDGVWTMRIDGSARTRLTSNHTDRRPAWSADLRTIYFERDLPRPARCPACAPCSGLFRIGSDGRDIGRLDPRNALGWEFAAAPAPDSWHLAYVAWTGCEGGTTSGGVRLRHVTWSGSPIGTPIDFSGGSDPAWSPDSRRLALLAGYEGGGLAVMNRDGSERRVIVSRDVNVTRPKWSPDGQWLMFAIDGELVLSRPDGTRRKRLTRTRTAVETPVGWLTRLP